MIRKTFRQRVWHGSASWPQVPLLMHVPTLMSHKLRNGENLFVVQLIDLDLSGHLIQKKQLSQHGVRAQWHEQSPATGLVKAQCKGVTLLKLA